MRTAPRSMSRSRASSCSAPKPGSARMPPALVIAANDPWNIVNYRAGLIRALRSAGYQVAVVAPDGPEAAAIERLEADFHPLPMSARGTSPLADLAVVARYVVLLRRLRPAAFLGFTAKP